MSSATLRGRLLNAKLYRDRLEELQAAEEPDLVAINIVTGWNGAEFRAFGGALLPDGDPSRYVRAREFIDVLRGLWTTPRFSFD